LHHRLLDSLGDDGQVDWSRAAIDSVRCGRGVGKLTGANPVDRGKAGSKYHRLIDATGLPLAVGLSAANTHDSQLLEPLVDAVHCEGTMTRHVSACMPCSFGLLPHPRSGMCAQPTGLLEVTVVVRWIPLETAAYGRWVARPARTTMLAPDGDVLTRPEGEAHPG
jgi:hypothetical protein